jgi:hypothetical protein
LLEVVEEEIELLMDHQVQLLPQQVEEELVQKHHIQIQVLQEVQGQLILVAAVVVETIIQVVLADQV